MKALIFLLTVVLFVPAAVSQVNETKAVPADSPAPVSSVDEMQNRIRLLEAQVSTMQAELARMKEEINKSTEAKEQPASVSTAAPDKVDRTDSTTVKPEPKTQQQKLLGVDLGSVRLTPYGTIYFNAFNNTGPVNNQDVPLFAATSGQGGASASARQTRLGVRFEGAKVGNAKVGGVIEADFFGGFPTVGIGENFGVVRIRLANVKVDWEKTSVTVGQDWMPFAPVNPTSLAAAAIPQMAAAGNNWARIPQVRVDQKLGDNFTLSGAILAPQTGDHPAGSTFFLQPNSGAVSRMPFFQSRVAFAKKNWFGSKKVGSIGFSGHYGRSKIPFGTPSAGAEVESYGLALDWNFPLHKRVSLSGEGFFGRDLGGFQAGVFQGVNTEFAYRDGFGVRPAGARGIATRGGWTQVGFTPDVFKDRWSLFASIGIDDPRDQDLTSVSRFNFRTRNLAYAFNTIYKVTPQFSVAAEFRRFATDYFVTGRRTSEHINLGAAYSF